MDFIGNQKIISRLNTMLARAAISPAYLFSGGDHIGKASVARSFARALAKGESEMKEKEGSADHIDIITLSPREETKKGITKRKKIEVEEVRGARRQMALGARQGSWRAIVVDGAEYLTIASQNAFLKTLEDPIGKCVLIFVSPQPGRLLPTVLSRCVEMRFSLVSDEELMNFLRLLGAVPEAAEEIIALSLGRPGLAKILFDDEGALHQRREVLERFKKISSYILADRLPVADEMAEDVPRAVEALEVWADAARRAASRSGQYAKWYALAEDTEQTSNLLQATNASARLLLERLVCRF